MDKNYSNGENYGFFAMIDRMQYINRWGLMHNTKTENIKEHSFDVAVIAYALCVLHNKFADEKEAEGVDVLPEYQIKPDPFRVQGYALYHDCTEIITGDLPTPIKYRNEIITRAYKDVEQESAETLAGLLPEFMQEEYMDLLAPEASEGEAKLIHRLVKAADRISAFLKCLSEVNAGNREFTSAMETIRQSIEAIGLDEVDFFMEKFVPSYGMTLDELNAGRK